MTKPHHNPVEKTSLTYANPYTSIELFIRRLKIKKSGNFLLCLDFYILNHIYD